MSLSLGEIVCQQCQCDQLQGITGFDNPESGFAYNVFWCDHCGTLYREDVWSNKGITLILQDGEVIRKTHAELLSGAAKFEPAYPG